MAMAVMMFLMKKKNKKKKREEDSEEEKEEHDNGEEDSDGHEDKDNQDNLPFEQKYHNQRHMTEYNTKHRFLMFHTTICSTRHCALQLIEADGSD